MRTTAPIESQKAGDTVTRLMRGLFGNLLTIAGSGVRPQSMVWQLFGLNFQYDLPKTDAEWIGTKLSSRCILTLDGLLRRSTKIWRSS